MKKFKMFLILFSIVTIYSLDVAFGWSPAPGQCDRPGSTGVPLDGGLLTILSAAGAAYFVARKKKKDSEV